MSSFYEAIGRIVVAFMRRRFGRQLQVAGGRRRRGRPVGAYLLASRDVEEG